MANATHRVMPSYIATATVLFLTFPSVGELNTANLSPTYFYEFEPLADASKLVAEAFAPSINTRVAPETVFSLMTDVAACLINESKPLDRDFAKLVEKEFWNLLQ